MLSATDFLPARMIEFMNFETTRFPYFGSGLISRFSALWRRDIGSSSVFSLYSSAAGRPGCALSRGPRGLRGHAAPAPGCYAKRPNHLGRFAPYLERLCLR